MSRGVPGDSPAVARSPSGGEGVAGAVIAIDWGCPNAPKRPKPHYAAVKSSEVEIVKFKHAQELVEKVRPPALVFAEATGPYLELCQLHDAYGGGSVFAVDARLTAGYRRANNTPKSDENDAKAILRIAEDYLAGRLSQGVWPFEPDPLRRALREAERLFRCYQKLRAVYPERAEELKLEWQEKVGEVQALAKEDGDCRELIDYLCGFGETGTAVPTAIAELRGKRFHGVERLYAYARRNKRLQKAISSLAHTIWLNKNKSERARKVIERLASNPRYNTVTKNQLKKWILVRAAWAAKALPRR